MQVAVCPDLSQLKKLVSGHLPPAEVETLVQHLETCPDCLAKVPALPAASDTLMELLAKARTPPVGWQDPIVARLIARLSQMRRGPDTGSKMLVFACPACGKNMKAKSDLAGKNVKCPGCSQVVRVPAQAQEAPGSQNTWSLKVDEKTVPPQPAPGNQRSEIQLIPLSDSGQAPQAHVQETFDFLAPPQEPDELGRLGSYRVLKKLGAGGMGVVFLAEDTLLHRKVALKTMLPAFAANAQNRERFLREARAAASIEHDHIVAIHQADEDNGVPYLAMPLLKGEPLDARLEREGKLPLAESLRIAAEMAEGLDAAHAAGLIHRDVKPGNVWLETREGEKGRKGEGEHGRNRVKLLDFGLARSQREDAKLTQSGAVLGTPAYMPPEQAQGETVDARADLFSLGCVLYEMLTGERPFRGENTISLLAALALQEPTPACVKNPAVPVAVSELTMRLLAKNPAGRPASAGEVARLLRGQLLLANKETGAPDKAMSAKVHFMAAIAGAAHKWRYPLLAACALVLLVPLGYWAMQVVIIRDKDGKEIARVKVPKDGSYEVVPEKGAEGGKKEEAPKEKTSPPLEPIAVSIVQKFQHHHPGVIRPVRSVALSGDGKLVLTGSFDKTAILWEAASGKKIQTFQGHTGPVESVALSADAKRVLTGSQDKTAILWDADSGAKIETFKGHTNSVFGVALSGDGKHVLTGSFDNSAILWEASSGKKVQSYEGHTGGVGSVALSGDGKQVLTGSLDNSAILWEASSGKKVQSYEGHSESINGVALSGNGKHVLTGSWDGTAILWDAASGKKIEIFLGHGRQVTSVAFSRDGKRVLTGSYDDTAILWDATSGKKIQTIPMQHIRLKYPIFMSDEQVKLQQRLSGGVTSVAIGGDGKRVLTGLQDGTAILWEVKAASQSAR